MGRSPSLLRLAQSDTARALSITSLMDPYVQVRHKCSSSN